MSDDVVIFDERPFEFQCSIQTIDGSSIKITQSAIINLQITESMFNGFPEGVLLLENNGSGIDAPIIFEGNNMMNLLFISIVPMEDKKGKMTKVVQDDNFKLEDVFSIYSVVDEPIGEYPQVMKKIFFRQLVANEMRLKKNAFTVSNFLEKLGSETLKDKISIENWSNNERAMRTGTIIRKLLEYDSEDPLKKSAGFKINDENWDCGKHSIFPNWAPGTETLYESVQKVYMKHVSKDAPNDKCYFRYDRFKKDLSLMSMLKLFEKNEDKNFFLECLDAGEFGAASEDKGRARFKKAKVSLKDLTADLSRIRSIQIKDLSAEVLEKNYAIVVPPVTDFDNTTRFNLGEKDIRQIYEKVYVEKYIKEIFKSRTQDEPKPMVMWENFRRKKNPQYNKILHAPYKSWNHSYDVEVHAGFLNTLIMEGSLQSIISLRGATHRTAGKWIDINIKGDPVLHFAKIPGRWLITECTHIFTKDKYWNSIKCIKPYRNF